MWHVLAPALYPINVTREHNFLFCFGRKDAGAITDNFLIMSFWSVFFQIMLTRGSQNATAVAKQWMNSHRFAAPQEAFGLSPSPSPTTI